MSIKYEKFCSIPVANQPKTVGCELNLRPKSSCVSILFSNLAFGICYRSIYPFESIFCCSASKSSILFTFGKHFVVVCRPIRLMQSWPHVSSRCSENFCRRRMYLACNSKQKTFHQNRTYGGKADFMAFPTKFEYLLDVICIETK